MKCPLKQFPRDEITVAQKLYSYAAVAAGMILGALLATYVGG